MKKCLLLGLLCAVVLATSGCLVAPVVPPLGAVYSGVKAPLDVDADNTAATGKKGTSSSINILWLVAVGDASVKAAAEEGAITKVEHVDYEFTNVLFFFSKYTTVVYGQ